MGPANIAELALNLAINTCFGLSGTKRFHASAGGLMSASVGLGIISFFIQIFAGGGNPPPEQVGISQTDLDQSLNKLFDRISDDTFKDFENVQLAKVTLLLTLFQKAWDEALAQKKAYTGMPEEDAVLNQTWLGPSYDSFRSEVDNKAAVTLNACSWVQINAQAQGARPDRRYETLSLYLMSAALYLNVCQLCMLLEWQKTVDLASADGSPYALAYKQWHDVDIKAWRQAHATWVARSNAAFRAANPGFGPTHAVGIIANEPPDPGPEPVAPGRPVMPKDFTDLTQSASAVSMAFWSKRFIAYADPIVTEMEQGIAARAARRAARAGHAYVVSSGPLTCVLSDPANAVTGPATIMSVALDQKTLLDGIIAAGLAAVEDVRLKYVTDEEVATNRATIDRLKRTWNEYDAGTDPRYAVPPL